MNRDTLERLAAFFPAEDIEWRVGSTTREMEKGMALAYLTNRAIQQRLDDVCGPNGWRNEYRPGPEGGVVCGLSIYCQLPDDTWAWVTKWDGADNTHVEAVKGGLSDAMKRAGYQWGIGRYLYRMPSPWVRLDDKQRFVQTPSVPPAFLPGAADDGRAERLTAERLTTERLPLVDEASELTLNEWYSEAKDWPNGAGRELMDAIRAEAERRK